jgi:hypothetical protein
LLFWLQDNAITWTEELVKCPRKVSTRISNITFGYTYQQNTGNGSRRNTQDTNPFSYDDDDDDDDSYESDDADDKGEREILLHKRLCTI